MRNLYPGDSYGRAAGIVKNLWASGSQPELSDLRIIQDYYHRFFSESTQNPALEKALKAKNYGQTAKEYRLIKENGVRLIVPWSDNRKLFDSIRKAVDHNSITQALLHTAAPITISCFDREAVKACATPIQIRRGGNVMDTGYYILNPGFESRYNPGMGFLPGNTMYENLMA